MSKFDEAIEKYKDAFKDLGVDYDEALLIAVAKGLGPSIYNEDSERVGSSDQSELDRVKSNFLVKKLGLANNEKLDEAINEVIETFGSGNRNKYRAMFYYLLVQKFKKASVYK